jgi:hypothetical protein
MPSTYLGKQISMFRTIKALILGEAILEVALQNSVKSFKRAAPREQLANGPDMIGQICGHGRGGLER